jgi:hypothetical protein
VNVKEQREGRTAVGDIPTSSGQTTDTEEVPSQDGKNKETSQLSRLQTNGKLLEKVASKTSNQKNKVIPQQKSHSVTQKHSQKNRVTATEKNSRNDTNKDASQGQDDKKEVSEPLHNDEVGLLPSRDKEEADLQHQGQKEGKTPNQNALAETGETEDLVLLEDLLQSALDTTKQDPEAATAGGSHFARGGGGKKHEAEHGDNLPEVFQFPGEKARTPPERWRFPGGDEQEQQREKPIKGGKQKEQLTRDGKVEEHQQSEKLLLGDRKPDFFTNLEVPKDIRPILQVIGPESKSKVKLTKAAGGNGVGGRKAAQLDGHKAIATVIKHKDRQNQGGVDQTVLIPNSPEAHKAFGIKNVPRQFFDQMEKLIEGGARPLFAKPKIEKTLGFVERGDRGQDPLATTQLPNFNDDDYEDDEGRSTTTTREVTPTIRTIIVRTTAGDLTRSGVTPSSRKVPGDLLSHLVEVPRGAKAVGAVNKVSSGQENNAEVLPTTESSDIVSEVFDNTDRATVLPPRLADNRGKIFFNPQPLGGGSSSARLSLGFRDSGSAGNSDPAEGHSEASILFRGENNIAPPRGLAQYNSQPQLGQDLKLEDSPNKVDQPLDQNVPGPLVSDHNKDLVAEKPFIFTTTHSLETFESATEPSASSLTQDVDKPRLTSTADAFLAPRDDLSATFPQSLLLDNIQASPGQLVPGSYGQKNVQELTSGVFPSQNSVTPVEDILGQNIYSSDKNSGIQSSVTSGKDSRIQSSYSSGIQSIPDTGLQSSYSSGIQESFNPTADTGLQSSYSSGIQNSFNPTADTGLQSSYSSGIQNSFDPTTDTGLQSSYGSSPTSFLPGNDDLYIEADLPVYKASGSSTGAVSTGNNGRPALWQQPAAVRNPEVIKAQEFARPDNPPRQPPNNSGPEAIYRGLSTFQRPQSSQDNSHLFTNPPMTFQTASGRFVPPSTLMFGFKPMTPTPASSLSSSYDNTKPRSEAAKQVEDGFNPPSSLMYGFKPLNAVSGDSAASPAVYNHISDSAASSAGGKYSAKGISSAVSRAKSSGSSHSIIDQISDFLEPFTKPWASLFTSTTRR